jgi:hypothetical protein
VAAGRPWNEDLGQAIAIGATTGMIDAFTDHYGDMLVERAMTPRPAGAGDDADGWRRPGVADDVDGRPNKLRDAWDWLRGLPGDEQGSIRLGPAGEDLPPVRWDPDAKQWYDTGKGHRFISFEDAQAQGRRFIVDDLPGQRVDIDEAARFSGIPRDHLEGLIAVHGETQTIGGYRTANPLLGDLRTSTTPKEPIMVRHPVTGELLKITSQPEPGKPKFKTTEFGLVGTKIKVGDRLIEFGVVRRPDDTFELLRMGKIVSTDASGKAILDAHGLPSIKLKPGQGVPMGPDIDTYFLRQQTGGGYVNLGTDTPGELAIRELAGRATSDYRPGLGRELSAIVHGPAQPSDPSISWGDALVIMPDGRLMRLKQREVEAFFQYHGLTSQTPGPSGSQYFSGTGKPWTEGATPNSIYTQFNPKTGRPLQTALYDPNGLGIAHVDWKRHGIAPPGHLHYFPRPGDPSSGHTHGPGSYYDPVDPQALRLPSDWDVWP